MESHDITLLDEVKKSEKTAEIEVVDVNARQLQKGLRYMI